MLFRSILYFHPEQTNKYQILDSSGNPTTAGKVNQLIRNIKKHEVRRNGKQSQACTRLNLIKWENIINQIEDLNDVEKRLYLSALFRYQVCSFVAIQHNIRHLCCFYSNLLLLFNFCSYTWVVGSMMYPSSCGKTSSVIIMIRLLPLCISFQAVLV